LNARQDVSAAKLASASLCKGHIRLQ